MQTWPLMTIDEETSLVLPRAVLESYSEHGTSSSATPAAGNSFVAEIIGMSPPLLPPQQQQQQQQRRQRQQQQQQQQHQQRYAQLLSAAASFSAALTVNTATASDDGAAFLSSGCFSGASFSGMPMVPASATPDAAARAEAPQGTQMLDEAGGVSKGNGAKRIRPKRPSRPSGVGCSDGTDEGSSSVAKKKTKRVRDRSSRTLCEFPGCKTGACSGSDNRMCKRHGGGHRCTIEGCDTSARGGTGLCIK